MRVQIDQAVKNRIAMIKIQIRAIKMPTMEPLELFLLKMVVT